MRKVEVITNFVEAIIIIILAEYGFNFLTKLTQRLRCSCLNFLYLISSKIVMKGPTAVAGNFDEIKAYVKEDLGRLRAKCCQIERRAIIVIEFS
jgi:hypothetical protein